MMFSHIDKLALLNVATWHETRAKTAKRNKSIREWHKTAAAACRKTLGILSSVPDPEACKMALDKLDTWPGEITCPCASCRKAKKLQIVARHLQNLCKHSKDE